MSELAMRGGKPTRRAAYPSWPQWDEAEATALRQALDSGIWWRKGGSFVKAFENEFAQAHGAEYGLAVANGTDALEIALGAAGIGPGDEVLVPAFTFISTALAVQRVGAVPVPVDIASGDLCIHPEALERALTGASRAIIPVHMAGHIVDYPRIREIADRHGLLVIQDAAHAHGARAYGRLVGEWQDTACFSFQNFKLMTAGEGGIILFNDRTLHERAFLFHNCGRSEHDTVYEHEVVGMNSRMSEFAAAILLQQLRRLPEQNKRRHENGLRLLEALAGIPGIRVQNVHPEVEIHPFYMVVLYLDERRPDVERDAFVEALRAEGVPASVNYRPLYDTRAFWQGRSDTTTRETWAAQCPNTERVARRGFWIHHRALLGEPEDALDCAAAIRKVVEHI